MGQAAFGSLTVLENLRLHGYAVPAAEARDAVDAALAVFPRLAQRAHQPASTLSGGERQMLVLAKALVKRAPGRLVWASNWPHPLPGRATVPDDAVLLDVLLDWAPDEGIRNRILAANPAKLYGFG